jgi:hypothetical protein
MSSQFWKLLTKHIENPSRFSMPNGGDLWLRKYQEEYAHLPHYEAFFLFRNNLKEQPKHTCGEPFSFDRVTYKYRKSCLKCGRKAHNRTPVVVNGVQYDSKESARQQLNLSVYELDKIIVDDEIVSKYNKNGLISKETLSSMVSSRKTMRDICNELSIGYESLKFLFDYYQIPTKWYQLEQQTYDFLYDRDRFINEFESSNSEELAVKYNCSPSTILQWADKYDIDRSERFQSAIERHVIEFIHSLDPSLLVISRDTAAIGMEIDVYIPSKKLGIEFDGLYYHTDVSPFETRNKHLEKQKSAFKHGIKLIRFVDIGETTHKLDIVKSMIKAKLGYSDRIYARKCSIVYPTKDQANQFFNHNHISGTANAKVYMGLEYEGTLIEVCSFASPRFDTSNEWELIRLATLQGKTVVGGLSKIIKHFRSKYNGSLMTYANLRFGNGDAYRQVGFEYTGCTGAGYFYTDMKRIYSRHMFRKDTIHRLIPSADNTKPEGQIAYENGFKRYKDCGHAKFVLK